MLHTILNHVKHELTLDRFCKQQKIQYHLHEDKELKRKQVNVYPVMKIIIFVQLMVDLPGSLLSSFDFLMLMQHPLC